MCARSCLPIFLRLDEIGKGGLGFAIAAIEAGVEEGGEDAF